MPEPLRQIIAELPHVNRNFIKRRRDVCADLHIHIAKPSGPIGIQMAGQSFVTQGQPFRRDDNLTGLSLKNLVVDRDEGDG